MRIVSPISEIAMLSRGCDKCASLSSSDDGVEEEMMLSRKLGLADEVALCWLVKDIRCVLDVDSSGTWGSWRDDKRFG